MSDQNKTTYDQRRDDLISLDTETLRGHKVVMCAQSPFFRKLILEFEEEQKNQSNSTN